MSMMVPYETPAIWPVTRLYNLDAKTAAMIWRRSYEAVGRALANEYAGCPACHGSGSLVSYIRGFVTRPQDFFPCPTCEPWGSKGRVKWPIFGLEDLIGGWWCCPICGEGQHPDPTIPCEPCMWWAVKSGLYVLGTCLSET